MRHEFKEIFGQIRAEEVLKERTRAFLEQKTRGYCRAAAKMPGRRLAAAAFACSLLLLLGGSRLYFTPVANISIDINPSIELEVNRFERVISVTGFNGDGQRLSGALDVKHRPYTEAIRRILENDTVAQLLSGDEVMAITVAGPDGPRCRRILSEVEACTAQQRSTYCYFAPSEEVAGAHEAGLSCGKYRAFLELQLLDPDITPEEVQGMTMREIRERIDSLAAGSGGSFPPHGGHGNGNGHHGRGPYPGSSCP